jgi:hydrogenase maturation protease
MTTMTEAMNVLVMGVGNTLLQDDGIGIHVTEALKTATDRQPEMDQDLTILDGGTIGLSLLPEVENADALIIVDAAEIGKEPGSVGIFIDEEIDQHLSGKKRTVHEVAVVDLLSAADIQGRRPAHCALIAIQPASTDWGLEPTPAVRAAIPAACEAISTITTRWRNEP